VSSYRFCRTDDIGLLVDALNRCWAPYVPDEPPMDAVVFKRSIRDLQVWCSSCMVAFAGPDPVGVLIGAKRTSDTLVHRIAVHPDHTRQGHGRHLLTSLCAKLAILGPPRIVAEVPEQCEAARALFAACGFSEDALLTDVARVHDDVPTVAPASAHARALDEALLVPVTVDDLAANGLLDATDAPVCWARAAETLMARKAELSGLALVSDQGFEAFLLFSARNDEAQIVALRSLVDDGEQGLRRLCAVLPAMGLRTSVMPRVHPSEASSSHLEALGFRPAERYRRFAGHAAALAARAAS